MADYARIKRGNDLTDRDVAAVMGERRAARSLLDHLAKIARPGEGAAKVLLLFARMASDEVPWVEGGLRVELVGSGDETWIETKSELGLGMHERVFPLVKMKAPLVEFRRILEHSPETIEPLVVASTTPSRVVLAARASADADEAPESVPIGDESLFGAQRRRASKPVGVRKTSSSKLGATKRASKSDSLKHPSKPDAMRRSTKPEAGGRRIGTPIPPQSGRTLRPPAWRPPAPTRTKTMRPAVTGVPPHRKSLTNMSAVPRPPRLPKGTPTIPRDEPEDEDERDDSGDGASARHAARSTPEE